MDFENEPSVEERARELRKLLGRSQGYRRANVHDGALSFSGKFHWKREAEYYDLPRAADVVICTLHQTENDNEWETKYQDPVHLTVQQYEYILDLLRERISFIEQQPGSLSRINLLEERYFAVDILCTLDI